MLVDAAIGLLKELHAASPATPASSRSHGTVIHRLPGRAEVHITFDFT